MSFLRPTTREWALYPCDKPDLPVKVLCPGDNPGLPVKVLDGLCHWHQNLVMVGPGVAEYIKPPLTYWGCLKLEDCPPLPMVAQLHMKAEVSNGMFIPVCVRLSGGGQIVFVDSITVGVLKKTPGDFPWPPPELVGPTKAQRVQQEREEPVSLDELRRLASGLAVQERLRFDGEGKIRSSS